MNSLPFSAPLLWALPITYHLPLNHVQDDGQVRINCLLARGRQAGVMDPLTGLLQVTKDLLLQGDTAQAKGPSSVTSNNHEGLSLDPQYPYT